MKNEIIKDNENIIAHAFLSCANYSSKGIGKNELLYCLSKEIQDSGNGYAGFSTKENLDNYLREAVFDKFDDKGQYTFALDNKQIIETIKAAVMVCSKYLSGNIINVFVFPTFSQFVKEKMSGATGYTPWRDTILVFINPTNPQWKRALMETVGHEFNHAVFLRDKECGSLLDSLIFEGLAEHFREQTIGGDLASWTTVLNLDQAKTIFSEIKSKNQLLSTDPNIRQEIFFGGEKYARWSGYSLGYYIVGSFLKNNPKLNWQEIMAISPEEILNNSGFGE